MITLTVNGKKQTLDGATGLVQFLDIRGVNRKMIAIGINGEVVHRDRWPQVVLKDGDVVDIVHMVGGG